MITKMKKLTFLVYHKEYEEFLNSLRELGVVHIVEKQQGAADNTELQDNIRLSNRLAATLKLLQNQKHEKNAVIATEGGTAARGMQVLDEVDALQTEHGKLSQQLQSYAKEKEALEAWGNFEPANVQKLKDAGYVIGFYSCSEGNYKEEWETEYNAMIVNRISSKVFFVTVTKGGEEVSNKSLFSGTNGNQLSDRAIWVFRNIRRRHGHTQNGGGSDRRYTDLHAGRPSRETHSMPYCCRKRRHRQFP